MIAANFADFKVLQRHDLPNWDGFVASHPQGSIHHTSAMLSCEAATKRHEPFAIGAVDSNGKMLAALVAVRVMTISGIAESLVSRSVMYAEPIYEPTETGRRAAEQLVHTHDEYMRRKVLFSEVRPLFAPVGGFDLLQHCGYERIGYINYEVDIRGDEEELFHRIGPKRRNNVRSARRKGIAVRIAPRTEQSIDSAYSLITQSYAHSKVPVVDKSLFESALSRLDPSEFQIFTATLDNEPVAVGCFLSFKGRVICWYAGTKRIPGVYATTAIFWEAMKYYSKQGYQTFDLCGGGWQGEDYGPGKFKSKFGGIETNFGRYRKVFSPWKMKAAETVYSRMRDFISPKSLDTTDSTISK